MISVGADNPYGHPTAATLATLAAHGVRVLRTDRDGTIVLDVGIGLGGDEVAPAAGGSQSERSERVRPGRSARHDWPMTGDALALPDRRHRRGQDRRDPGAAAGAGRVARAAPGRSRSSRRGEGTRRARPRGAAGRDPGDVADRVAPLPARRRGRALARSPARRGRRRARRSAARPDRGADRPRQGAGEARARRSRPPAARSTSSRRRARGRCRGRWSPKRAGSASGSSRPRRALLVERMGAEPGAPRATSSSASRSGRARGARWPSSDLDAMVADTSEALVWSLADALRRARPGSGAGDRRAADRPGRERHRHGLRRSPRGCAAPARRRARARATEALADLEVGLGMHPYAAKQLAV